MACQCNTSALYQIIYFRWGVSLGWNTVGRLWDNRCIIIIILTTSTVRLTSILLLSSFHRPTTFRYPQTVTLSYIAIDFFSSQDSASIILDVKCSLNIIVHDTILSCFLAFICTPFALRSLTVSPSHNDRIVSQCSFPRVSTIHFPDCSNSRRFIIRSLQ
jgi:hypothetical protein